MYELNRFFSARTEGERVIGTYLWPLRLFGHPDPQNAYAATEVIQRLPVASHEVLITRNSGLFVQPPQSLFDPYRDKEQFEKNPFADLREKMAFEEGVAVSFNHIICNLTLSGVVSEPASPVHISYGQLIDGHALVTAAGGGREVYLERTLLPARTLKGGDWLSWPYVSESVLQRSVGLACADDLSHVSVTLPGLVAAAYSSFSRRQLSEALMTSWIVVEQIINDFWKTYLGSFSDSQRRTRLKDGRTYTAAVQIEVLLTLGRFDDLLGQQLHKARDRRNKLAHGATISLKAAQEGMDAMKAMIELVCGQEVAQPQVSTAINW